MNKINDFLYWIGNEVFLTGVIGLDVSPSQLRQVLAGLQGPVGLHIASPGGLLQEGIEIHNLLRTHGDVTVTVEGLAASSAAYLSMGAKTVRVFDNSVFMIHNSSGLTIGDAAEHYSTGDILESFDSLLAAAFAKKSGKSLDEVRALMAAESYFFGQEIVDAGFADELIDATPGRENAVAQARLRIAACATRLESRVEPKAQVEPGQKKNIAPPPKLTEEVVSMDFETLSKDHPALVAQAALHGAEQERARIIALREYTNADPGNIKVAEIVENAINSGKSVQDVAAHLQVAIRDHSGSKDQAPDIGVKNAMGPDLSAQESDLAKKFNLKPEEILAAKSKLGVA